MINDALVAIRKYHGISQTDLSNQFGISNSYLSEIEKGKKKPKITIYIDGPFFPDDIPLKEARKNLRDKVYNQMIERSKESNFEYIKYQKKSK